MEWSTITCFHMTIKLRGWKRHFRMSLMGRLRNMWNLWKPPFRNVSTCGWSTHWTLFRGTWHMCIHHLWSTRTPPWNEWSTTVRCGQQRPHSRTGMGITMTEDSCWMNARCAWGRKKISKPIWRFKELYEQFIIVYPRMYPDVSSCIPVSQNCKCLQSNNIHFDFGFSKLRLCSLWKKEFISLGSWGIVSSEETVVRLESNNKEQSFTLPKAEQLQYDAVYYAVYYAVLVCWSRFCLCCVLCGILCFFSSCMLYLKEIQCDIVIVN